MNESSLCVIGDAFFDVCVPTHHLVKGGAFSRNISISPGGTANVSVWASRLGIISKFIGKVGNDPLGHAFRNDLKNEKVADLTLTDNIHSTGICVSLIDEEGNRTMVTSRGANDHWVIGEMEGLLGYIEGCKILYTVGYSLISERNAMVLETLVRSAKEKGSEIWFNPGAYNIIGDRCISFMSNLVDVLILNLDEGRFLTGEDSVITIIDALSKKVATVIMTLGEKGSVASSTKEYVLSDSIHVSPVVDTTGAGDAFTAGFISARMTQCDLKQSCELAHLLAAQVIQRPGGR
ncbi:MAG: carbohydrate kinase family protein [Chloroflexota bacterium]|nr:carbohydrate kinase family protein [Chloroflexota bacterium]